MVLDDGRPSGPRIIYYCPFGQHTGYARAAHDNLMALRKRLGPKLYIAPLLDFDTEKQEDRYKSLLQHVLTPGADPKATHAIVHVPPFHAHLIVDDIKADVKILMSTWETDRYPKESGRLLNAAYDAMIVPCVQNRDVFREAGFTKPIHVVPHCHDPSYWALDPQAQKYENFTFYWIGVWSERKNPIGLLKAYFSEFRADERVQLIMACPQATKDDIETLALCMGMPDYPKLIIMQGTKTDEQIRDLHRRSHCYVSAARGEGFGLGAHEAALLGNWVIATDFAGHNAALAHEITPKHLIPPEYDGWLPIDWQFTPAVPQEHQAQKTIQIAGLTITPKTKRAPLGISADQRWAEPDLSQMRMEMRDLFRNMQEATPDRRELHDPIWNAYYSYAQVGELLYNIVQETHR